MNRIILSLLLVANSIISNAQMSYYSVNDTVDIDEVVITGSKISVNRNQIPLTISVIQSRAIEESTESSLLPILSNQVPGVFVTERGVTGFGVATGSAGQISIRGIGGSPTTRVLVLLNGNPQYMGIMGHPLADAYRSANIERVEVVRGPASTLYGSNAMGGVINIITKERKTDGFSTHANVSYGSFNTQKYAAGGGFMNNGFSVYAGINHDRTDGHRDASFFDITDGYFKSAYVINEHFNVSVDFSLAQFNGADPGLDTSDIVTPRDTLDILRGMGAIVFNNSFDKANGSVRGFYNFGEHDISSGFISNDFNYGIVAYENFNLIKGNTLTFGIDYKKYGGIAELTKYKGGVVLTDTSLTEFAGYATIQQNLFNKLTLNVGLRIDNHSIFGTEFIPSAGVAYNPWINTNLKASVSKGFRSPTIKELFIQFPFAPAPNSNLKPEEVINYEVSAQQKLLQNSLSFELALFHITGNNFINVGMNDANQLTFLNTGAIKNTGVEFAAKHSINKWVTINTNYTYINMDTPVTGTPKHKLYIGTSFTPNKFRINLSYQYINDLAVTPEIFETYNLLSARVSYQVHETTNVYIEGDNLLNQSYQINYGYPMPGLLFKAGVNFKLFGLL